MIMVPGPFDCGQNLGMKTGAWHLGGWHKRRASNKGCLDMTLDRYLQLVDWTGRQLRKDKPGAIDKGLPGILQRLECSADTWLDLVRNFRKSFRTEAGSLASLAEASSLRRACRVANHRR